ncbi:HEAT repeat-containing protein 4 [Chytridiales sp. JEL 0842]|nr:HEAT repeat-containing protein 4 [Chytridiales sp. JEL 0842]
MADYNFDAMGRGSKRHARRGYRSLQVPSLVDDTHPLIPRPHRKDLMQSILRTDRERQAKKVNQLISSTPNLTSGSSISKRDLHVALSNGLSLNGYKRHSNPVAAAMDTPYVPNTRMRALRPPIRLPATYETRVKELQALKIQLRKQEEEREDKEMMSRLLTFGALESDYGSSRASSVSSRTTREQEDTVLAHLLPLKFDESVITTIAESRRDAERKSDVKAEKGGKKRASEKNIFDSVPTSAGTVKTDSSSNFAVTQKTNWARDTDAKGHAGNNDRRPTSGPSTSATPSEFAVENTSLGLKAQQKGVERNVPYMLEMWPKSEAVDLEEPLNKTVSDAHRPFSRPNSGNGRRGHDSKSKEAGQHAHTNPGDQKTVQQPAILPTLVNVERPSRPTTPTRQRLISRPNSSRSSVSYDNTVHSSFSHLSGQSDGSVSLNSSLVELAKSAPIGPIPPVKHFISHSTLRVLKKLARDAQNHGQEHSHVSSRQVEDFLKLTLQGLGDISVSDIYTPTRGITNEMNSPTIVEKTKPQRRRRKFYRIKASGGIVADAEASKTVEGDFQFIIPFHDEEKEDGITSDTDESASINVTDESSTTGDDNPNSENYAVHGAQNLVDQLNRPKVIDTSSLAPPNIVEVSIAAKEFDDYNSKFSLSMLIALIKRFNKKPKTEPPAPQAGTATKPAISNQPAFIIEHMGDFLDTPYSYISTIPPSDSPAYAALTQTLNLCLTNEESMDLRFEAARILVIIGAHKTLNRFEGINLRSVLSEMMREGDSYQAFLGGCVMCELNWADSRAFRRVKKGLGDLNKAKREMAVRTFEALPLRFGANMLELLIAESENTSWKARVDVVSLLETWVTRLAPANIRRTSDAKSQSREQSNEDVSGENGDDKTARQRHEKGTLVLPDPMGADSHNQAGDGRDIQVDGNDLYAREKGDDTRSRFTVAAANVGAGHLLISNSQSGSVDMRHANLSVSDFELRKTKSKQLTKSELELREAARLERLLDKALEILLKLMWNDWSAEVRNVATGALSRLGKGRPIFEWVLGLLESPDPARRIDALKGLSKLGFMPPTAMNSFLVAFKDPYSSVRIEACKCLNDHDEKVKAYAVKALSRSNCREPRVREAMHWCLNHERSSTVRAEAIRATFELDLIPDDVRLKNSILTILDMDKEEPIRREAARVLAAAGVITIDDAKSRNKTNTPAVNLAKSADGRGDIERPSESRRQKSDVDETQHGRLSSNMPTHLSSSLSSSLQRGLNSTSSQNENVSRGGTFTTSYTTSEFKPPSMAGGALPEPLQGHNIDEIEIYFRESLVGEPEQRAVIDQVRQMAAAKFVLKEVEEMENETLFLPDIDIDFELHQPMKFEMIKKKPRRKVSIDIDTKPPNRRGKHRTANYLLEI